MACVGAPLKPGVIEYRGQEPSAFKTKVDRQGVEQMLSLMSVGLQVCTRGALLQKAKLSNDAAIRIAEF